MGRPREIIAHRGYSAAAPENTLAAIEAALAAGAASLEWDVRVLSCGTPILFHDDTLDRTTDRFGPVDASTFEVLRQADAGSWYARRFAGERIPTLAETMDGVCGRVEHVYPEIKSWREPEDLAKISRIVRECGMSAHTTFISMDWIALEQLRATDDEIGIGYIVERSERFQEALERASDDGRALLDPDYRILLERPEYAAAAVARGIPLTVWTVNRTEDAERLAELGVTGFTTDEVERMLRWSRTNTGEPR